jgi:cytochrome c553
MLLAALLAGCGGHAPPVDAALVAKAQALAPGATAASLDRGRELLVTACTKCHGIRTPSDYTLPEWQGYLREMAPKAELNEDQVAVLLRYITVARTVDAP